MLLIFYSNYLYSITYTFQMIPGSFQTNNRLINYSQSQSTNADTLNSTHNTSDSTGNTQTTPATTNNNCFYRPDVISKLQKEYSLISMITVNLATYYQSIRNLFQTTTTNTSNIWFIKIRGFLKQKSILNFGLELSRSNWAKRIMLNCWVNQIFFIRF